MTDRIKNNSSIRVFKSIVFVCVLLMSNAALAESSKSTEGMNVIFILTDDQRYDELGLSLIHI